MNPLLLGLAIAWAAPWSLCGMLVGLAGLLTGGGMQRRGRVLEFHGGFVDWFLRTAPLVKNASAVTFGHVVLGRTRELLDATRAHEFVHVRQYERWGPLFVPAYLFHWCLLWMRGKHPYWDNPFERQAYDEAD